MFEDFKNNIDFHLRNFFKFSRKNYKMIENIDENDYFNKVFIKYFQITPSINISILDVGCKNFSYAKSIYNFFTKYCANLTLDGVELDSNRLYTNFFSRKEVALSNIKTLENVSYIEDNVLNIDKNYDYITWFLPFVDIYPLIKWGLPKKYFMPETLLKHVYSICNKKIFIINQGENEYNIQKNLYEKLNIKYKDFGKIDVESNYFKQDRFLTVVEKD